MWKLTTVQPKLLVGGVRYWLIAFGLPLVSELSALWSLSCGNRFSWKQHPVVNHRHFLPVYSYLTSPQTHTMAALNVLSQCTAAVVGGCALRRLRWMLLGQHPILLMSLVQLFGHNSKGARVWHRDPLFGWCLACLYGGPSAVFSWPTGILSYNCSWWPQISV